MPMNAHRWLVDALPDKAAQALVRSTTAPTKSARMQSFAEPGPILRIPSSAGEEQRTCTGSASFFLHIALLNS
jgi:hypothetical protein